MRGFDSKQPVTPLKKITQPDAPNERYMRLHFLPSHGLENTHCS
jgi:hypothetical protein